MKGIEEVTAYRTKDGKLFANAFVAELHAEVIAEKMKKMKDSLGLVIKEQCRCKRIMKGLRGIDAALMQSLIDHRSANITRMIRDIKDWRV